LVDANGINSDLQFLAGCPELYEGIVKVLSYIDGLVLTDEPEAPSF
jgi:hypothetical protein